MTGEAKVRIRISATPLDEHDEGLSPVVFRETTLSVEEFKRAACAARPNRKSNNALGPNLLADQHAVVGVLYEVWELLVSKIERKEMSEPMQETDDRLFILWNTHRDGELRYPGKDSDGVIGRVSLDNVYLSTYANYPDDKHPRNLEVGQRIDNVKFSLSGETGIYSVYRVR